MMASGEATCWLSEACVEEQQSEPLLHPPDEHEESLVVELTIGKLVMNLNPGSLQKRMARMDMIFRVTQLLTKMLNYGRPNLRHLSWSDTLGIQRGNSLPQQAAPNFTLLVQTAADIEVDSETGDTIVNSDSGFRDNPMPPFDNGVVVKICAGIHLLVVACPNDRLQQMVAKFNFIHTTFGQRKDHINGQLAWLMQNRMTVSFDFMHTDQFGLQFAGILW